MFSTFFGGAYLKRRSFGRIPRGVQGEYASRQCRGIWRHQKSVGPFARGACVKFNRWFCFPQLTIFWSPFAFTSFSFIYQFICLLLLLLSLYLLLIVLIGRTEAPGIVWLSPPVLLELCVLCTEHNLFIWTEKIDYSFWRLKFPGWESRKKEQRTRDNKSAGFRCFTTGQNCARFTRFNDCVHAVSRSIVLISLGHGFCFFLIYFTFPRMSERKI